MTRATVAPRRLAGANCTLHRGGVVLDQAGVGIGNNGYSLMLTLEGTVSIANPDTLTINCLGEQTASSKLIAVEVDAINEELIRVAVRARARSSLRRV